MIFLFTLVKGINFWGDSVPNEDKGITASKEVTVRRQNIMLLTF